MINNLQTLVLERRSDVLLVFLNRPKCLNAVNATMRTELSTVLSTVNGDKSIRAVVLTGKGDRAFSAGQDLEEAASFDRRNAKVWMEQTRLAFSAIRNLDKPCVAAVNGIAAGAGLQLALLCDLRVGDARTRMSQPEIKAGLGSILGSYLLTLYLGLARSMDLSLTARFVESEECLQIGLLNRITDANTLTDAAIKMAEELALQPPGAFRLTKRRYRQETQEGFENVFSAATECVREAYDTGEPQTVMSNFIARRGKE